MISSHPQDEGMLSDRNEQDLFNNSEKHSDEGYSDNGDLSEAEMADENDGEQKDFHFLDQNNKDQQDEQNELKKNQVKATCLEKLKGYFGFGTLLNSQKIGSIFLVPIPSKWTFECQVVLTQVIISFIAYALYFSFRYAGLNLSYQIMKSWSVQNLDRIQFEMLTKVCKQQEELFVLALDNSKNLIQIMSQVVEQQLTDRKSALIWPNSKLYSMTQKIPNEYLVQQNQDGPTHINRNHTHNFTTYLMINDSFQNDMQLNDYSIINFLLPFQFENEYGIINRVEWIFNNVLFTFPGIQLDEDEIKNYIRIQRENLILGQNMFGSIENDSFITPFTFGIFCQNYVQDPIHQNILAKQIIKLNLSLMNSIGIAYIDADKIQDLFYSFVDKQLHDIYLIIYDKNGIVLNNNYVTKYSPIQEINKWNFSKNQIEQIRSFQPNETSPCLNLTNQNDLKFTIFKIEKIEYEVTILMQNDFFFFYNFLRLYDYSMINNELLEQKQQFILRDGDYEHKYLIVVLFFPPFFMLISFLFVNRWIQPMDKISEVEIKIAYQCLKKNQKKKSMEDLSSVKSDGLIGQLTELFFKLTEELAAIKHINKSDLIRYYREQTYPQNSKIKDLSKIQEQVDQMRNMLERGSNISKPDNGKLIPNFDE